MLTSNESYISLLPSKQDAYHVGWREGYATAIKELGPLRPAPPKILRAQKQTVQEEMKKMFDPKKFIESTTTGPMSTQITPCPEGTYTAIVSGEGDIEDWFREVEWKDKKTGEPRKAAAARIPFIITDSGVKAQLDRETIIVPYDVFLDVLPSGELDTGKDKNVKIGQLREALGQNNANWNFMQLRGAGPVMVKVSQRSDPKDPQTKYAQVDRVAKVS